MIFNLNSQNILKYNQYKLIDFGYVHPLNLIKDYNKLYNDSIFFINITLSLSPSRI